tara:strand:+ start:859 stop:1167 length:309 start_codon:yes stop_codon:yes gene_type:complete
LDNNHSPQNAISHKKLNEFLIKAKKDIYSNNSSENHKSNDISEFNDLVKTWTEASQKILIMLNKKENVFTDNRNPKALMAFGAMGAHINMALQALKATGTDQ